MIDRRRYYVRGVLFGRPHTDGDGAPMGTITEKDILEELIKAYEQSQKVVRATGRRIQIDAKKKFPDLTHPVRFREPMEAFRRLEETGIAQVRRSRNTGIPEKAYLPEEQIGTAYAFLGRTPKTERNCQVLSILDRYEDSSPATAAFCAYLRKAVLENRQVRYLDNAAHLETLLAFVSRVENNQGIVYEDELSAEIPGCDTHTFRSMRASVLGVLKHFGAYADIKHRKDILKIHDVYSKNYLVKLRGTGTLYYENGDSVNLANQPNGFGISCADVNHVSRIDTSCLLTVENETVFDTIEYPGAVILYTGGFPGSAEREMIRKTNADIYLHSGDIDAGGFMIFEHILQESGHRFVPYRMDRQTLSSYQKFGLPLTKNDRERLARLLSNGSGFSDVIRYMLDKGIKLEQENIWREERRKRREQDRKNKRSQERQKKEYKKREEKQLRAHLAKPIWERAEALYGPGSQNLSLRELKVRHRRLSGKYHPDVGGDPRLMTDVNVCYDYLRTMQTDDFQRWYSNSRAAQSRAYD